MSLVSVVIPMYNVGQYIGQCLNSLVNQTFIDFEAICIDDGSTDDTLAIARKTVREDPRFIFVSQLNAGQSTARNVGIERAEGKYVLFLDADDFYAPNTLYTLFSQAEEHQLDDLFFSAETFYEDDKVRRLYRDDYENHSDIPGVMPGWELMVKFCKTDAFSVSPALQFVRRSFLIDSGIRFPEGIIHEDNLFTCMMLAHAKRTSFLNERLYKRRIRSGSTMTATEREPRHVYGHFKCAFELEKWLMGDGLSYPEPFKRALLHHIAFCYDRAAFDALSLEDDALVQMMEPLPNVEALSFQLHVIEHAHEMRGVRNAYLESTTYKVGRAIMALPCWVKERCAR